MKREEKIKLLQAVKDGLLMPEDIRPARIIVIKQMRTGGWQTQNLNGEAINYTEIEMESFKKDFETSSQRRVNYRLDQDIIIKISYN
jgi:hypothetical protein